jgi:hypothetical protein
MLEASVRSRCLAKTNAKTQICHFCLDTRRVCRRLSLTSHGVFLVVEVCERGELGAVRVVRYDQSAGRVWACGELIAVVSPHFPHYSFARGVRLFPWSVEPAVPALPRATNALALERSLDFFFLVPIARVSGGKARTAAPSQRTRHGSHGRGREAQGQAPQAPEPPPADGR